MTADVEALFEDALVLDATAPILMQDPSEWRRYARGGVDVVLPTITLSANVGDTVQRLAQWTSLIKRESDSLVLARSVEDIHRARAEKKLAMVFHFQNTPIDRDVNLIDTYAQLGVRVIQLTYNFRNAVGDGCLEPENAGLSAFGRDVVREMNESGIVVDLSHTGERTTLDAMEASEKPDVFTHANARGVFDHPRNLSDDQIRAVAEKGGVIGVCSSCVFLKPIERPSVDDVVDHLDYFVQLVGIDHVGLGVDAYDYSAGYHENVSAGIWDPKSYPKPPIFDPLDGSNIIEFAAAMDRRGYGAEDIRQVLGGNFMRVFEAVWKG